MENWTNIQIQNLNNNSMPFHWLVVRNTPLIKGICSASIQGKTQQEYSSYPFVVYFLKSI